jgi:hypothetical protein
MSTPCVLNLSLLRWGYSWKCRGVLPGGRELIYLEILLRYCEYPHESLAYRQYT